MNMRSRVDGRMCVRQDKVSWVSRWCGISRELDLTGRGAVSGWRASSRDTSQSARMQSMEGETLTLVYLQLAGRVESTPLILRLNLDGQAVHLHRRDSELLWSIAAFRTSLVRQVEVMSAVRGHQSEGICIVYVVVERYDRGHGRLRTGRRERSLRS